MPDGRPGILEVVEESVVENDRDRPREAFGGGWRQRPCAYDAAPRRAPRGAPRNARGHRQSRGIAVVQDHLEWHVRGALRAGVTPEEVREVLIAVAGLAGFPAAWWALEAAEPILAEHEAGGGS
jgi:hypothetical protein